MVERTKENLIGKEIKAFLKRPEGYRYGGVVKEQGENFIVIYNEKLQRLNYLSYDNIDSFEVVSND